MIQVAEPADDWLGPRDLAEKEEEPGRGRRWMFAIPVGACAIAASAYVLASPEAQAWLAAAMRALS